MQYPLTIYEDENYGGMSMGVDYGMYSSMQSLGFPNDAISSIKIAPWATVKLYVDNSYLGPTITLVGPRDLPTLQNLSSSMNWEDTISSMAVIRNGPTAQEAYGCCTGATPVYKCGRYSPGNSAVCTPAIASYCSNNLGSAACKTWCRNNPGTCDAAVIKFCDANPADPYCSCIKSPATQIKGSINPKCIDRKCLDTGYLTANMRDTPCPSVINCDMQVDMRNSGLTLSSQVPLQQNCGDGNTTAKVDGAAGGGVNIGMWLMILVFVFIVAIAAYAAYAKFAVRAPERL